jgi:starch synthase
VVSRVGGLADTVVDAEDAGAATGVQFGPVTTDNLIGALRRTNALFRDKSRWLALQRNGMAVDVSWRNRASQYADLYRQIDAERSRALR